MVTLTDELFIHEQGIGVATEAEGFENVDGILGLGPTDLTIGTLSNATQAVPTVTDELFSQGKIPRNLIGMRFSPSEEYNVAGQLDFGQVDHSDITGDLTIVPITKNRYDTNPSETIHLTQLFFITLVLLQLGGASIKSSPIVDIADPLSDLLVSSIPEQLSYFSIPVCLKHSFRD
jgi:hypothetical protein